jgi:c-di-GMP-binding flagellar brake protein YcgR
MEDLLGRRGDVELCGLLGPMGEACGPLNRVKLLDFNAAGLVVERPERLDVGVYFTRGTRVRVLMPESRRRRFWEFTTTVRDLLSLPPEQTAVGSFDAGRPDLSGHQSVHLTNESLTASATPMRAMALVPPTQVHRAQRRSFYRVAIAGINLLPVQLTPLSEAASPQIGLADNANLHEQVQDTNKTMYAEAGATFHARLVNISGGGIGVEVPRQHAQTAQTANRLSCVMSLPRLPRPLSVDCVPVHRHLQSDGSLYLGLEMILADAVQRRRIGDLVCRFTAWHQRQQLQTSGTPEGTLASSD